jgi:hypothetical protein
MAILVIGACAASDAVATMNAHATQPFIAASLRNLARYNAQLTLRPTCATKSCALGPKPRGYHEMAL